LYKNLSEIRYNDSMPLTVQLDDGKLYEAQLIPFL